MATPYCRITTDSDSNFKIKGVLPTSKFFTNVSLMAMPNYKNNTTDSDSNFKIKGVLPTSKFFTNVSLMAMPNYKNNTTDSDLNLQSQPVFLPITKFFER
jgi:predicted component of type VI protein secretion system